MQSADFYFSGKQVHCYFDGSFSLLPELYPARRFFIITDENLFSEYRDLLSPHSVFVVSPGEKSKVQETADSILERLIELEADRNIMIIGFGGGVITDLAGYVASLFKRGVGLGLVPSSLLAMVDAAIGGKNGINKGMVKNIIGTIYQPDFILFDYSLLKTLPREEWVNGFAEIIKHACIRDEMMFSMLERHTMDDFMSDLSLTASLVERNARLKLSIVTADEHDTDIRLLLNFGHTIGHAIENLHDLSHGHAVSIGMVAACSLSEKHMDFPLEEGKRIVGLLQRYHLPVDFESDSDRVFEVMKKDKKREGDFIRFILLQKIGDALVKQISLGNLKENLNAVL